MPPKTQPKPTVSSAQPPKALEDVAKKGASPRPGSAGREPTPRWPTAVPVQHGKSLGVNIFLDKMKNMGILWGVSFNFFCWCFY